MSSSQLRLSSITHRLKGADDALADVIWWFHGFSAIQRERDPTIPNMEKLIEIRDALKMMKERYPELAQEEAAS
jgi:hypothetical protein